jgi:hypothetical protein
VSLPGNDPPTTYSVIELGLAARTRAKPCVADRGDDRFDLPPGEYGAKRIGVVGFVGEQAGDSAGSGNQYQVTVR